MLRRVDHGERSLRFGLSSESKMTPEQRNFGEKIQFRDWDRE
jgi:hypothetical protein